MKCNECRYCILQDEGYSNYTVEGTSADCLLNLNEGFPCDNFYGERKEHDFAAICIKFSEGDPVSVDVDHESGKLVNYSNDPEIKLLLENY